MALATLELEPLFFSSQAPIVPEPEQPVAPAIDLDKYTNLIQKMAWKCARKLPPRAQRIHSVDDLVQDGWVVAAYCTTKYRPTQVQQRGYTPGVAQSGAQFNTYLYVALSNWYGRLLQHVWEKEVEVDVEDPELTIEEMATFPSQLEVEQMLDLQRGHLPFDPRTRGVDREELALRMGL